MGGPGSDGAPFDSQGHVQWFEVAAAVCLTPVHVMRTASAPVNKTFDGAGLSVSEHMKSLCLCCPRSPRIVQLRRPPPQASATLLVFSAALLL